MSIRTEQLGAWSGEFGKQYTERNQISWEARKPHFEGIIKGLSLDSVLEVGCNRGHNLVALQSIVGEGTALVGIEPNAYALGLARASTSAVGFLSGTALDLPFKDGVFDLVFTCGVLIHIALADLPKAMAEIHRVSRRYVLAVEYFAEQETPIRYRGNENLLWKRDFAKHYLTQFPDLTVVRTGYLPEFDRCHWWLFEKTGAAR